MSAVTGSLTTTGSVTITKRPEETLVTCAVSGTYGTVTFVFEGSVDGTEYAPVVAVLRTTGASVNGTISPANNAELIYDIPAHGLSNVRVRVTAIASGTFAVSMNGYSAVGLLPGGAGITNSTLSGVTLAGTTTISGVARMTGGVAITNTTPATITTAGAGTYSAAHLLTGLILRDPNGGARTDTTGTAAEIVAAVTGAAVNDTFNLLVVNTADAAEVITLNGGANVTLVPATITIAQNEVFTGRVRLTNVTGSSESVVIYGGNVAG